MDEEGVISARTPFFCDSLFRYNRVNDQDPYVTLHPFRSPAGKRDFVADYQNPQQDNMNMFDPREHKQYDCNNSSAFSYRDFPLFQPHYNKGGPYRNTFLNINPEYPTQWAPSLEHIPVFHFKPSQNSMMNNRQYGSSCENNYSLISDKRMYNSSSFTRNCNK